jgi:hypothetical protein
MVSFKLHNKIGASKKPSWFNGDREKNQEGFFQTLQ